MTETRALVASILDNDAVHTLTIALYTGCREFFPELINVREMKRRNLKEVLSGESLRIFHPTN